MANPLMQQVRSESQLRYGGTLSDLRSARRTNYHQLLRDKQTAEDVGRATKRAAKHSVSELAAIFNDADRSVKNAVHQIALAGTSGSSAGALAMALQGEAGAAQARSATARAMAQAEAVQREADATAGEIFAKRNAVENFRANRADLAGKARDIRSERRAFEQGRLGELETSATQQARSDSWKRGIDPDTGLPTLDARKKIAGLTGKDPLTGKPIPGGRNTRGRTRSEQRQVNKDTASAKADIDRARVWIRQMRKQGGDDKTIKALLIQGGSLPTTIDYSGRNSKGEKVAKTRTRDIPVPSFDSDFVRAAFELEGMHMVSKGTLHALRTTHNVHVPAEWLPPKLKRQTPRSSGGGYADLNIPAGARS